MLRRADEFRDLMRSRRTVRDFDARPVPRAVIEASISAAGTAPSGANQQPWHFVAASDPDVKRRIRVTTETEEREFYERRAPEQSFRTRSAQSARIGRSLSSKRHRG